MGKFRSHGSQIEFDVPKRDAAEGDCIIIKSYDCRDGIQGNAATICNR
jgi:hypothetical protein